MLAEQTETIFTLPNGMVGDLFATLCFGLLGILLVVVGYKIFDKITPKVNFQQEIVGKNVAAAVLIASMILGMCYIIAHVASAIIGQ